MAPKDTCSMIFQGSWLILITIWWLQKLKTEWQYVNNEHRSWMRRDVISKRKVSWRLVNTIRISNRFASLGNLNDSKDINRTLEIIKETMKISAKERESKVWTNGSRLNCSSEKIRNKVTEIIRTMNGVKLVDITGTKRQHLKAKSNELETTRKSKKNIRLLPGHHWILRSVNSLELIQYRTRVMWLLTATVYWLHGETISLTNWMWMGLIM